MNGRLLMGGLVFACATVFLTSQVLSDEKDPKEHTHGMDPAMMEAWTKAATPGPFHAHLKPLAGSWSHVVKMRMDASAPWEESTGSTEFKWILDGRFLRQSVKGDMKDGQQFEGIGWLGYDNVQKKYTSAWVDSMGTSIVTSLGTCDASGKVITMQGEYPDPITQKNKTSKSITRIINNNKVVFEMFDRTPEGTEFKTLEVTYTRK